MEIDLKKANKGGIIVGLSGNISIGDADMMSSEVIEAMSHSLTYVVFDFAHASLPNSRFLGKMMEIYKLNRHRGVNTFIFCGENGEVRDLFKAAYVDHIIPTVENVNDVELLTKKGTKIKA